MGTWRSRYRLAPEVGAETQEEKHSSLPPAQALRTLGAPLPAEGAGAPAHFRALGLAGASPALRSRTARGDRGSSGLIHQACIVAQWSVT